MKTRDDYWQHLRLAILCLMAMEDDFAEAETKGKVLFVTAYGQSWREAHPNSLNGLEITGMNADMCRHITRGWLIPESWEDAAKAAQEDREACARKCGVLPPDPWYR